MRGREFGDAIRALLRASDLTNRAAADLLGWQEAKVSELVNGKEGVSDLDLAKLLGLLRTPPAEFDHLMALHHDTNVRDWLQPTKSGLTDRARTLREHEKIATGVTGWSMNVVHGLLQAPDYTTHLVNASSRLSKDERAVVISNRMARQRTALDGGRIVTIYLHEQALRLPVGGPDVMADQFHHLLRMSVRPYLTLRVVPTAAGPHDGLAGSFDMLTFKKIPPIVYVESQGATVFLEDQPSVGLYEDVLKSLGRTALDEAQTRKLITDIIGEEACGDQVAEE
ncbi:Scr1 family TA system antitoxin-like transcriptional regulator [Lentzea sp. DG1S-22]|uniref:Scr1 family TA system antitoxin-like transcriptional regulator n=1 Tax=Lentzea sp. DG1S-22 TaxID=3108822 RepID=UPI002E785DF9|nr:Scr1 family TA system antitoxin-like transcriptional regulator [Lentzea sp. DG1S-22]WVH82623.1 Scr1 family TA system antitoxin-like transcriptional regulator [Lentzea sp. DG1S-22]